MSTVEERLQLMRSKIDEWSVREKLILASAVDRSGDQNWMSVSRICKPFAEPGRPKDWFSQKNCAVQYEALLEAADMPKRKKRNTAGDKKEETTSKLIVRALTEERIAELKKSMAEKQARYLRLKEEVAMIDAGLADDRLEDWAREAEEARRQKVIDAEKHALWLKEREEKKAELERAWKPSFSTPIKRKLPLQDQRRNSNHSEQSSEADSLGDSPIAEPLNVDTLGETSTSSETRQPTPTSPLLTSLLKTPSPVTTTQSSILHSAITSQRGSSPTITSLLSSSPSVPHTGSISQAFKPFAPSTLTHEEPKAGLASAIPITPLITAAASSVGVPTLSMLLELPPSVPGKPLPRMETVVATSTVTSAPPGDVCHPQHQEMRVRKETESDEILEVVEIDQSLELDERSEEMEIGLEEIIANLEASEDSSENLIQEEVVVTEIASDSSSLFDSLLRSEYNKGGPKYGEKKSESKGDQVGSVGNAANVFKGIGSHVEVMQPVESIENVIEVVCSVPNDKSLSSDTSLHTHELRSEVIEVVEAETDVPHAEFDAKTLAEMEIIIMDQVQELEIQETKEHDLESSTDAEKLGNISSVKDVEVKVIDTSFEFSEAGKDLACDADVKVESKIDVEKDDVLSIPVKSPVEVSDVKTVDDPAPFSSSDTTTEKCEKIEEINISIMQEIETNLQREITTPEVVPSQDTIGQDVPIDSKSENTLVEKQDETKEEVLPEVEIPKDEKYDDVTLDVPKTSTVVEFVETANEDLLEVKEEENLEHKPVIKSYAKKGRKPKERGVHQKAKAEPTTSKKEKGKLVKSKEKNAPKGNEIVEDTAQESNIKDLLNQETLANDMKGSEVIFQETPTTKIKELKSKEILSKDTTLNEPTVGDIVAKDTKAKSVSTKPVLTKDTKAEESLVVDVPSKDTKAKGLKTKVPPVKGIRGKKTKTSEKAKELKSKETVPKQSVTTNIGGNVTPAADVLTSQTKGKEGLGKEVAVKDKSKDKVKNIATSEPKTKEAKSKENKTKDTKTIATASDTSASSVKEITGIEIGIKETPTTKAKTKEGKKIKNLKTKEKKFKDIVGNEATPKETRKSKETPTTDSKFKDTSTLDETLPAEKEETVVKGLKGKKKRGRAKLRIGEDKGKVNKEEGNKVTSKLKTKVIEKAASLDSAVSSEEDTNVKNVKSDDNEIVDLVLDVQPTKEVTSVDINVEEINSVDTSNSLCDDAKVDSPGNFMTMEPQDVENSPDNTSAQESCDGSEAKHYCRMTTSKQDPFVENRPESPLTETSDAELTVGSIRSFGRLTETDDSVPNSPGSSLTDDEREYRAWKKAIMLVWSRISGHKYASLFLKPITDDQAPRYSRLVKRPLDLMTIKRNIETGAIRCTEEFQRDILLMFLNAQMYNSCRHNVFNMAKVMQEDSLQLIKDFIGTQKLVQSACESSNLRRETRTTDPSKREDSDEPRTPVSFKRKRFTDVDKSPMKKNKG